MDYFKALDEIKKSKGYDIALLTTFNFDVGFFERSVLFPLFENGTKDVSVFVDSKELNKALLKVKNCNIGQKYMVHPIEMNGAFHPKIILLLGSNSAKLFISSANLTQTGYSFNNEVFNTFIYDNNHPENLQIINLAIDFFLLLQTFSTIKFDDLSTKIEKLVYYGKPSKNDELFFIHNIEISILEQIKNIVKDIDEISIAVPYFDNQLSALFELKDVFPKAKINLYIQNEKSKFPVNIENKGNSNIIVFEETNNNSHFYHGKVFLFKGSAKSFIVYGSANCTQSALLKTITTGGNIECVVLETGNSTEFDEYFRQFKPAHSQVLNCQEIEYRTDNTNNFFFRYGLLGEKLDLFFGYSKKENVNISIDGHELSYIYENKSLKASVEIDDLFLNVPFNVIIEFNDGVENILGWFINPFSLLENRRTETKDILDNYEIESNSLNKYLADQREIIAQLSLNKDELEREIAVINAVEQKTSETPEDDANEEGIIDYVIPSADVMSAYSRYIKVNKIKMTYVQWYLNGFNFSAATRVITPTLQYQSNSEKNIIRKPTSEETSFRRFVVRRLKELFDSNLETHISFEHYLEIVLVFVNVFEKYTIIENVDGLFNTQLVSDAEYELISRLLTKEIPNNQDVIETVILLSINAIINIHKMGLSDYTYELRNKKLLSLIDKLFQIRLKYKLYLNLINDKYDKYGKGFKTDNYVSYFEETFGYLPFSSLKKLLVEFYGNRTTITVTDDIFLVEVWDANLRNHMTMSSKVNKEVSSYISHCSGPKIFELKVSKLNVKSVLGGDPAVCVDYIINYETGDKLQTINRLSGKKDVLKHIIFQ